MVPPLSDFGFYWIFAGFYGFLNIGFFVKRKPNFFWVIGFTGSTAVRSLVACDYSKHLVAFLKFYLLTATGLFHYKRFFSLDGKRKYVLFMA